MTQRRKYEQDARASDPGSADSLASPALAALWLSEGVVSQKNTAYLQQCLERLQHGDDQARGELIEAAGARLTQIAHTMLKDYRRVRRWEETADVVQNAVIRLDRTLRQVTPESLRDFYRLATLQIRRELIDLARHYFGPEGEGRRHQTQFRAQGSAVAGVSDPGYSAGQNSGVADLAAWTEFHEKVHALPDVEREVFDLVWYQGLPHTVAAELLGVSARTVKRRWQAACLHLHNVLGGVLPR
jgi:RNA polymerase sigma factor (sigma-70 family)